MGSGKGVNKRAQAQVLGDVFSSSPWQRSRTSLRCHPNKWEQFVTDANIRACPLTNYYLGADGERTPDENLAKAEYDVLVQEFFADAVAAGALDVPTEHSKEDFHWYLEEVGPSDWLLSVKNKNYRARRPKWSILFNPGTRLKRTTMGSAGSILMDMDWLMTKTL